MTLDSLSLGATARVTDLNCEPAWRERLAGLGLLPGSRVQLTQRLGRGGPLKLRIGRTEFVMRPAQAAQILIEPLESA
ncbi:MAG: FeoA family protein [Betaproteobacteria bacterium]